MIRIRTGYSFRRAVGTVEEVMATCKAKGYATAPITDVASCFGFTEWTAAAVKAGLRSVYGVELAVSQNPEAKKPVADHWTFLSRGDLTPLHALVATATEQFRYQPILTTEQALKAAKLVTVVVGHRAQMTDEQWAAPPEGAYYGLGPNTIRGHARRALEARWRPVALGDNRYPGPEDRGFYATLCGRNADLAMHPQHILAEEEWRGYMEEQGWPVEWLEEAVDNSVAVLQESTAQLLKAQLPVVPKPQTLRAMCEEGARLLKCDLKRKVYKERLDYELKLISEKKFEDYFYIVADLCQWARNIMFVGPARGSSCGSLVCYLLRITTVDPIPHRLIFERFIDITREDLPDIDIDFSDQQRHLVFEYMNERYGRERVARLGTITNFQPRSALNEVGAALKIPRFKIDAVAESLLERSSGDSRALNTLEDTLAAMPAGQRLMKEHPGALIAARFEGHPRHFSQHAAGVVVASEPIQRYVAVDSRTGATHCDKYDAEKLNLLKIDALGLTQLSVFEDALTMAGLPLDTLEKLPLNDKKAFDVLNKGQWSGIFQFNGMALQSLAKQFKVTEFEDIVSITALARPGPLASGGAHEWVRRKNGVNPVTYPSEELKPYLDVTLGQVLYQEQVLEIGRWGGLGWKEVTALRKAMSKSLGKEFFDQFGDPWKRGAMAKGMDEETARLVWDSLCAYGSWAFNRSHSVAYGLISYWCCWLKAHYPHEFAAATLTHENLPEKQVLLLREMRQEGIDYVPVDIKHSTDKWTVLHPNKRNGLSKPVLLGPLQNIKGVGPQTLRLVVEHRKSGLKLPPRVVKLLGNPRTKLDTLYPVTEAFKAIMPDPSVRNIFTAPVNIGDLKLADAEQTVLLFCTFVKINPRDENEAVNVARRGYEITNGPTKSLNLQAMDDTGQVFCKVSRFKYEGLGPQILDRGRIGKALYAVKGKILPRRNSADTFIMVLVEMVRYIGDMDHDNPDSTGISMVSEVNKRNKQSNKGHALVVPKGEELPQGVNEGSGEESVDTTEQDHTHLLSAAE